MKHDTRRCTVTITRLSWAHIWVLIPIQLVVMFIGIKSIEAQTSAFPSVSIERLTNLAEQGDAAAQNNLGLRYTHGDDVQQDHITALKWYHLAAEQGLAEAQNNIGLMNAEGIGTPRDDVEAVRWYRLSAMQKFAVAENNLGWMYDQGRGVERNYEEATKWYGRAAKKGLPNAQFNLAAMYEAGFGVNQNTEEAMRWYRKAAEQKHSQAKARIVLLEHRIPVAMRNLKKPEKKLNQKADFENFSLQNETTKNLLSHNRPPVTPPATNVAYRVQLAAYRNSDYSLDRWRAMVNSYPDILKGFGPVIKRVDLGSKKGVFFRLMTGSFSTRNQASTFCSRILRKGVTNGCIPRQIR